jgi:fructose-bisphosphate aldolase, class I
MVSLKNILKGGRAFYLAYDQGMEHGPVEFNDSNVDPLNIIRIARQGGFNGLIVGKGIAEKYHKEIKASKVPLIIKLNGKTNLSASEPLSRQLCTVKEAVVLGAKAVGYTIYVGSKHEALMLSEFENILRDAHKSGLPAIAWIYPRGKSVDSKSAREVMSYAARVGLEIDADMIKIKGDGNLEDIKWAVKAAGRCGVVIAGGEKVSDKEFLDNLRTISSSGAKGVAVGRNIWKSEDPVVLSLMAKKIVFGGKS